ncbi:hypothetical protein BGZ97_010251 [Linnemannia gamsii]|uniref:Uncharacterized protein n=1 Tax=Linnemannia gamsii TaxID=64522 RepID=A0A9P6UP24_9FUNG|nr:hypothetical protein BGZ97_010251 [Linnemannia gamsii]
MNNNHTKPSSYNPSAQQDTPDTVHSRSTAHSTHAFCETFDQATRDLQQQSRSASSGADSKEAMAGSMGGHRHGRSTGAKEENEDSLREANSAVQLDRDTQQSRRGTDDAKQGSSGRDGSWATKPQELPYIE